MGIKEKIKKIYQEKGIIVSDDYIEDAIKNKERVKLFLELYQKEYKEVNV